MQLLTRAGCAPPAALQQRHCTQQQQPQHASATRCSVTAARAAAGEAGASALAAAAAPPLLERGYRASPLSCDVLSEQKQQYYTQMGAAIRALQQDLPSLLEREPDLSVFAEGVVFEDRLSPRLGLPASSCAGREAYGRLMWSLRFHRTLFFCKSRVELQRMWEKEPGVVAVRWSAAASPRLLDGLVATSSACMSLDGVSEFHFNEGGHIMKHLVDCVSYSGPRAAQPLLARYAARRQAALVPGLAGGSWDECTCEDC
ncbi:hypothetical protein ABPG75_004994 [Micractinium tetrahymenae]